MTDSKAGSCISASQKHPKTNRDVPRAFVIQMLDGPDESLDNNWGYHRRYFHGPW
mgnify:FL=1